MIKDLSGARKIGLDSQDTWPHDSALKTPLKIPHVEPKIAT